MYNAGTKQMTMKFAFGPISPKDMVDRTWRFNDISTTRPLQDIEPAETGTLSYVDPRQFEGFCWPSLRNNEPVRKLFVSRAVKQGVNTHRLHVKVSVDQDCLLAGIVTEDGWWQRELLEKRRPQLAKHSAANRELLQGTVARHGGRKAETYFKTNYAAHLIVKKRQATETNLNWFKHALKDIEEPAFQMAGHP
ncbi:hypothetical protein CPB85DRAFT_1456734 [Mucidula mucida]|nr:hypothetical protein CPB85DRAFT_1456734 [Mucidula mucida]